MHLLKKGVPLFWDESSQHSFKAMKFSLMYAPLLIPPDYCKDFLLYLAATESTISMVLVQEDDMLQEHIIYYPSRGFVGPKLNHTHVEKLSLVVIHVVQRFHHYILLHKTTVMEVINPFQYVLTWWVIKGKISH